ncbi:MAG: cation transporting ATPase C-terminal domain-containing protein, partial [Clostridium sp.]|nr:cation transporting ATPase C-terminal domain-containing protein [Clostridium sp.]
FTKNKTALLIISVTAIAQFIFTELFSGFFNAVSLSLVMWGKVILLAFMIIVVNEVVKFVLRLFKK